jgi:REP element-mobilizing transposase RayT
MKANVIPLEENKFYHIYNRGIDGCAIFKKEGHYKKFLEKYAFHLSALVETYAYCLLGNHFHFLIRIKSAEQIYEVLPHLAHKEFSQVLGYQFAHLFNGYAQFFNLQTGRTGKLFDYPFRRIEVKDEAYFSQLIYYIHHNPQRHGLVADFRDYPHSSYHSHLSTGKTKLQREAVIDWFGGSKSYEEFHNQDQYLQVIRDWIIEVE